MPFVPFNRRKKGSLPEPVSPCAKEQTYIWRVQRRVAGLILLVMAGVCGYSKTAYGSCGDYVLTSHKQVQLAEIPLGLNLEQQIGGPHVAEESVPLSPPNQPCHGPHCRKQSLPPWLPLQIPAPRQQNQEKATSLLFAVVPELFCYQQTTHAHHAKPGQYSKQRVERPPRPVA